jgi:hypothetical protein
VNPNGVPDFEGPTGQYVVRAIDAAGNEDANEVTFTTVLCGDPGDGVGNGATDPEREGGCSTGGSAAEGIKSTFAFLLAFAAGRRRRSRKSGSKGCRGQGRGWR